MNLKQYIQSIPKAELHIHIEGSFEPELIFEIAERNHIGLSYPSVEAMRKAYFFKNLQEFLDIYYEGAGVLQHEQDFYDLTWAYLEKLHDQNARHVELFFDPQTHTDRGIPFSTVFIGIRQALLDAREKFGITFELVMHFLRHLPESAAFETLEQAMPFKEHIIAVGLDSSEVGHPPSKFERVFAKAREEGFKLQAHAGEEGPPEYVWEALKLLKVDRIDHGNRSLEDADLVRELVGRQMALTVCPISNRELRVVDKLENHPLKKMMDLGLLVTVNSDDPAYFRGSLNDNYQRCADALNLDKNDIYKLARNSFTASYLDDEKKGRYLAEVDDFHRKFG